MSGRGYTDKDCMRCEPGTGSPLLPVFVSDIASMASRTPESISRASAVVIDAISFLLIRPGRIHRHRCNDLSTPKAFVVNTCKRGWQIHDVHHSAMQYGEQRVRVFSFASMSSVSGPRRPSPLSISWQCGKTDGETHQQINEHKEYDENAPLLADSNPVLDMLRSWPFIVNHDSNPARGGRLLPYMANGNM